MNYSESFLITTAKDYDMDLRTVKDIAKKSLSDSDFYDNLEDHLKVRRLNH